MRKDPSHRVTSNTEGKSLAQQNFAKEADVNGIVNRHMDSLVGRRRGLSGIAASGDPNLKPIWGDFSSSDLHDMMNRVMDAQFAFNRLPARIRGQFGNNPVQLVRFVEDPANMKQAVKMGLIALPEGQVMTEEGNIVEQGDIVKEAAKSPSPPPQAPEAPRPDPEAQPDFNKGGKK